MRKFIIALFSCIGLSLPAWSQSASAVTVIGGYLNTFDNLNYTQAIDEFYQGYDNLMHNITMIEQNYQRIQQAIEAAKSWSWDDLDFNDGDFLTNLDIRDELQNAQSQIDRQKNNLKQITNAFTQETIVANGRRYSLCDLAGLDDSSKTMKDFVRDVVDENKDSLKSAAISFCEELTDAEKELLNVQSGMDPVTFYEVKELSKKLNEKTLEVFANAEEKIKQSQEDEKTRLTNKIVSRIFEVQSNGGQLTQTEASQTQALLSKLSIDELRDLRHSLNTATAYSAWKDRYETRLKEAEKEQENELNKALLKQRKDGGQEIF